MNAQEQQIATLVMQEALRRAEVLALMLVEGVQVLDQKARAGDRNALQAMRSLGAAVKPYLDSEPRLTIAGAPPKR